MKKIVLLLAISFTLTNASASVSLYGETLSLYNDGTGGASPGTRPRMKMFSVPFVNATIESNKYIDVIFQLNGVVEIEITDSMGFVRDRQVIDTVETGCQLRIDISTLSNGEYKIKFKKKASGEILSANFFIN
ncbi:hypothetical protein [Dysgonomonas sp. 25]|uniref:hypothetical protein n=1 Tax=Dysgonomonas sp. 25 TaxID=2302933 RepID=UPI0013D59D70|nr:hypothetical protein [Dysgonomonas sp. 25]